MHWEHWNVHIGVKQWRAQLLMTPANWARPNLVEGVDFEGHVWVRAGPGRTIRYYKIGMRLIPVGGFWQGNFAVRCRDKTLVGWWKLKTPKIFGRLRPPTHIDLTDDTVVDLSSMD